MITVSWLIAVPAIAAVLLLLLPFGKKAAGYLALLVSLAVAALSWWAIERPVLAAARRWRERRRAKLRAP